MYLYLENSFSLYSLSYFDPWGKTNLNVFTKPKAERPMFYFNFGQCQKKKKKKRDLGKSSLTTIYIYVCVIEYKNKLSYPEILV